MFERFTDSARRVVVYAQEESRRLQHDHIGSEHLLLGMLREPRDRGALVLTELEVRPEDVRADIEAVASPGERPPSGHVPFTTRAKRVLELALRESLQLQHSSIGPEHILIGILAEGEGTAAQVLTRRGVDLEGARLVVADLPPSEPGPPYDPPRVSGPARQHRVVREVSALVDENARLRNLLRRHGIDPDSA